LSEDIGKRNCTVGRIQAALFIFANYLSGLSEGGSRMHSIFRGRQLTFR
jgi:hypothetical protein